MITLLAPAKINLFLRILGKRDDGYHAIASLFQTLDLADQLQLEIAPVDSFTCSAPALETADNLVMKALALFRSQIKTPFAVKCHLVKSIPLQAGLGGGSSDAAAMLNGLNQLLNHPLADDELLPLATQLGSDVPYFLKPGPAYCEGRGELVKRLKPLEKQTVWIIKPPFGLSTPQVYQTLNLASLKPRDPKLSLEEHLLGKGEYYNDLEEAAFALEPSLATLKASLLDQGFSTVLLSGSGSSLFCLGTPYPTTPPDHFVRKCCFT